MECFVYPKTRILVLDYPNHKELKKELISVLENYKDVQNKETNVKATMTEWNISSAQIEYLKMFVLSHANKMLWHNPSCQYQEFWANIYRKGDHAIWHSHVPDHLAMVYFLKSKRYYSPLCFQSFGFNKRIFPKEGRLVIFPAHLKHKVPKHKYNGTRITLAANMTATKYRDTPLIRR